MPIRPTSPPPWVQATGCEIAGEGKCFKYLGISTSNPINEAQVVRSIVVRIEQKLKHWSNRFLSWPARTLLLKHVLAATPLYQLLSVGIHADGIEELEKLCRHFLWGWGEDGSHKAAVIAWERVANGKTRGGLGWTQLKFKAQAMYIETVLKVVRQKRSGLLQKIKWDNDCEELPAHLTLAQGLHLMLWGDDTRLNSVLQSIGWLRKAGITSIREGKQLIEGNIPWRDLMATQALFPEEEDVVKIQALETWLRGKRLLDITLLQAKGWKWRQDEATVRWEGAVQEWTRRLESTNDYTGYLNEKWHIQDTAEVWKEWWAKLWAAPVSYRRKVWIWRLMQ
ncbi:hypothetical protein R1sor_004763 [Riccia sorocarpa]|uniref:Reverse transcriptase n=1 Tax=Riccia sorocarpa TaxID=122646 RepID=A0ABD3HHW2_9MARC